MNLFSKQSVSKEKRCVVLYYTHFDRSKSLNLFDFLKNYFIDVLKIKLKYAGFYNENYLLKYAPIETIESKIVREAPVNIVNFSIESHDLRKKEREVGIEFNITRPVILTVFYPVTQEIDLLSFLRSLLKIYPCTYGFTYTTKDKYWITAYAIGDFDHTGKSCGIEKMKKKDFDNWKSNCEKIAQGFLRDVFHENILGDKSLQMVINGETLMEAIKIRKFGVLTAVCDGLKVWQLNAEELEEARRYFYASSLII